MWTETYKKKQFVEWQKINLIDLSNSDSWKKYHFVSKVTDFEYCIHLFPVPSVEDSRVNTVPTSCGKIWVL